MRLSGVCNFFFCKVEQIIHECSGKSIAKSRLNYKGIRYNGDGMLLGWLNVVNMGLLLGLQQRMSLREEICEQSHIPIQASIVVKVCIPCKYRQMHNIRGGGGAQVKAVPSLYCKTLINIQGGSLDWSVSAYNIMKDSTTIKYTNVCCNLL